MFECIPDDEVVLRSVRKGWLKRGELTYSAYRPSANNTLVSVLRGSMGIEWCRDKAVDITGSEYVGLAVLRAQKVRELGALVVDAPDGPGCFPGHAHIDHVDPPLPQGDPLAPEVNKVLNDRCKALAKASTYHPDEAENPVDLRDILLG